MSCVLAIIVQVSVVEELDRIVAIVLLGNVHARPMADPHAKLDILETEAKALPEPPRPDTDVTELAHGRGPLSSGICASCRELRRGSAGQFARCAAFKICRSTM